MRITFLLPSIGICGGVRAVFEFANCLQERGHDVSVLYPLIPMRYIAGNLLNRTRETVLNFRCDVSVDWFDLKAKLIRVLTFQEAYIPDADVIVATWWETAYDVKKYGKNKGEKFYLVQHYETWGGPEKKVEDSYKLGLRIIINSTWLKTMLQDRLKVESDALIFHAPDWNNFYPENVQRGRSAIRILMPYRSQTWKGATDGIQALGVIKKKFGNLEVVMFGSEKGRDIPFPVEYHRSPSDFDLRKIYNSCDIFVFPSRCEGFGMPPMEAMACKCAVVTTNVGAVPDYAVPGETALVCEPRDIEGLVQNISRLVEDKDERKRIAENGHNHIKKFTWTRATGELEEHFLKYI